MFLALEEACFTTYLNIKIAVFFINFNLTTSMMVREVLYGRIDISEMMKIKE